MNESPQRIGAASGPVGPALVAGPGCASQQACRPAAARHSKTGFTLLELLVVVGLVAAISSFLVGGLKGGDAAALQSAQALLANLTTAARAQALASGQSSRLLIHSDAAGAGRPSRFLRCVVLQTQTAGGWLSLTESYLPPGVYVVPGNFSSIPAGLFATGTAVPWEKADGSALRSTALRSNQIITEAIAGAAAEQWVGITISANAGTVQSGDIVLAAGRVRPPGSFVAGESPVELLNPENVRGLTLSSYAVPALINARTSF